MPTAKAKGPAIKRKNTTQQDQFKDYEEPSYRVSTAKSVSRFQKIFSKIGLDTSNEQRKTSWDRLRTQNFQDAGNWYTSEVYSDDRPKTSGRHISATKIQNEISMNPSYVHMPLSECKGLNPLQAATRYVSYIVDQEGQDGHSFIYDLQCREKRIDFVTEMFASAQFTAETWRNGLTKMLFPATRQGAWRKSYLLPGIDGTKKRTIETFSGEYSTSDSGIGDLSTIDHDSQVTDQEQRSILSDTEPASKRAKVRPGARQVVSDRHRAGRSMAKCGGPDAPMPEPLQLPRMEAEIGLQEEPHQNIVGESVAANSLPESAAARDAAKPFIHVQHEPISTQPHFEAPAAISLYGSPKPVFVCADNPRQGLISPITTSDIVDSAIKEVDQPNEPGLPPDIERRKAALESVGGGEIGTSAGTGLGLPTLPTCCGLTVIPDESNALNRNAEDTPALDGSDIDAGRISMKILPRAKFDEILAELAQMRRRIAELERQAEKQEVTIKRYDKRIKEQDEEIAEQTQEMKELKASFAEKDRELAETLDHMKAQHNHSVAQKDEEFANLKGELQQKDHLLSVKYQRIAELEKQEAEMAKHGNEREIWILQMEQNSKNKNQIIRSLHGELSELASKILDQISDGE
jgi:hypothetical protein